MSRSWSTWIPTPGNVIFVLIVVMVTLWTQQVGASILANTSASTTLIPYQGRISDNIGSPYSGSKEMTFALYTVATGGTSLWSEQHNGVTVNQGLFNVMLGSITPIPQSLITDNNQLYLGVTIGSDREMTPRAQLGSVPFAIQALTVPDGSVTTAKLADGAVTMAKLGSDAKLSLPTGAVIMWSGAINTIPADWQLCDGANGTPDLRNRFVVGAGGTYALGNIGGSAQITLTIDQMPAHTHTGTLGPELSKKNTGTDGDFYFGGTIDFKENAKVNFTTNSTGGSQPFDNRPPYYALAFICKK